MISNLVTTLKSGQSGLILSSVEPEVWFKELADSVLPGGSAEDFMQVWFWDAIDGLTYNGEKVAELTTDTSAPVSKPVRSLMGAIEEFLKLTYRRARYEEEQQTAALTQNYDDSAVEPLAGQFGVLVIRNFDRFISPNGSFVDPIVLTGVLKSLHLGSQHQMAIVMQVAPGFEVPPELVEHTQLIEHHLPDTEQRGKLITELLSQFPEEISGDGASQLLLDATAGLSGGKLCQYVSESVVINRRVDPMYVFEQKAKHLSRASKLDVWSPLFERRFRLWPNSAALAESSLPGELLDRLSNCIEPTMVGEQTSATNVDLSPGEIRVRISYVLNSAKHQEWLDPMPAADFERLFRPERNFYSLNSVIGLTGLKSFLRNGLRPGIPERSKMKHVLMLGVPGTGKSFTMQCCSGEFKLPLSTMQAGNLYSKWLGETDKILDRMLRTVEEIGGILSIDEFQRFLPTGNSSEGGVESRMLGTLLTWFNNQKSTLVLSAANNISNLPDEITRSGRVDALIFVGFPGAEAKKAAWEMYIQRHELPAQQLPSDNFWTPADIMSCCRLAELQSTSLVEAAKWITPSYEKNKEQMDDLLAWAESAGCVCAETGLRFVRSTHLQANTAPKARQSRKVSI